MFQVVHFKHPVKLRVRDVGSNVREVIEDRVRSMLEGVCGEHGYVRHNTVRVVDVSRGVLSKIDMGRHYGFTATVKAEVCNPLPGLRFRALVRSINRFGMLCEGGYYDPDGTMVPVIEAIVVRNPATIQNEVDVGDLLVGDEVVLEILGRQFELRESRISAYARTVADAAEDAEPSFQKPEADSELPAAADEDSDAGVPDGASDAGSDAGSDAENRSEGGSEASDYITEEGMSLGGEESDQEYEESDMVSEAAFDPADDDV